MSGEGQMTLRSYVRKSRRGGWMGQHTVVKDRVVGGEDREVEDEVQLMGHLVGHICGL